MSPRTVKRSNFQKSRHHWLFLFCDLFCFDLPQISETMCAHLPLLKVVANFTSLQNYDLSSFCTAPESSEEGSLLLASELEHQDVAFHLA